MADPYRTPGDAPVTCSTCKKEIALADSNVIEDGYQCEKCFVEADVDRLIEGELDLPPVPKFRWPDK